jgi:hypothetical protein
MRMGFTLVITGEAFSAFIGPHGPLPPHYAAAAGITPVTDPVLLMGYKHTAFSAQKCLKIPFSA